MSRQIVPFGAAQDGRPVEKILLRRGRLEAEVMTLGAAVLSLRVPDREGRPVDVVLGWNCPAAYEENGGYLGMLVGRYANRIAGSRCVIDGQEFRLTANEGTKQLHGGPKGFGFQLFQPEIVDESTVRFHHTAPDGENGFPGTLRLTATYTLTEEGLRLHYQAETDKPTLCNLTNHSYFNLNGGGSVLNHRLWVDAEHYTPVDADSIPTAYPLRLHRGEAYRPGHRRRLPAAAPHQRLRPQPDPPPPAKPPPSRPPHRREIRYCDGDLHRPAWPAALHSQLSL